MHRRSRKALLLLAVLVISAGAIWRATVNEQRRGQERRAAQLLDGQAADLIFALGEFRAGLFALVAPQQSAAFWTDHLSAQLDVLDGELAALETPAAERFAPLTEARATFDRVRGQVRLIISLVASGEPSAASRRIFGTTREDIQRLMMQLSDARQSMARAASSREGGMAHEQSLIAGGLICIWLTALLVLVMAGNGQTPNPPQVSPADEPQSAGTVGTTPAETASPQNAARDQQQIEGLAAFCDEAAHVRSATELQALLARAATVLSARVLVVWLRDAGATALVPALAHGYDVEQLARRGPLAIDAQTMTSTAFRTSTSSVSTSTAAQPRALAVPLITAEGTTGVLAAELADSASTERLLPVARIIATQFAVLCPSSASDPAPLTPADPQTL
jgi:hypothetical protein